GDPRVHRAGPPGGGRRAAAVPAVRPAAGPQGAPLPPAQRLPPLGVVLAPLPETEALELLRHGTLDLEGRLVEASNTTLRAFVALDGVSARCVYKPVRGERPLWDFPDGTLAGREVSAYLLGSATGWACVPPTVLRDGPLGPVACQGWIDEPLPAEALEVLRKLRAELSGGLGAALAEHLTAAEVAQVAARVEQLLTVRRFPAPDGDWPAIPWPPI